MRVLDLFGVFRRDNRPENDELADAWALYDDFRVVAVAGSTPSD